MTLRISILHNSSLIVLALLLPLLFLTGPSFGRMATAEKGLTMTVTPIPVTNSFWNGEAAWDNGALYAQAAGGTAPYLYTLEGLNISDNNGYFTLLSPGTYTVQVTDATGQTTTVSAIITSTYPIPSLNFSNNVNVPSSCTSADGSFTLIATGGTPPYQYSIDGGVTWTTQNVFTNLRGGQYVCLVKDANNMEAVVLTNPNTIFNSSAIDFFPASCPLQVFADGYGNPSCPGSYGGTLSADALGGTQPYTWSLDNITYQPALPGYGAPIGDVFQNLAPGFYTVYVKDANGNIAIGNTNITAYCDVVFTYVTGYASCQGGSDGSMTITPANGVTPYTYTIDGIHYQSSNTFTGLAAGIYNVTVMDAIGHWKSGFIRVQSDCPQVTAIFTNADCNQQDGTITATGSLGATPYSFSKDGVNFQSSNVFTGLAPGLYTITLRDANYSRATTSVTIGNNCLQLTVTNQANTTCSNSNGSFTIAASNGTAPYAYSRDGVNFQSSGAFTGLSAGSYTITVRDAAMLTATAQVTLTDAPGPLLDTATRPASCTNTDGTITLMATGGTAPLRYSIDGGASFQPTGYFTGLKSGQYSALILDANGCSAAKPVPLAALPVPAVSLGTNITLCDGQTTLLAAPQQAGYTYLWQDNSTNPSYTVSQPGSYSVTVTNSYGCQASGVVQVFFMPLPSFTLGTDINVCTGQTTVLKSDPAFDNAAFLWSTGSTAPTQLVNSPGLYSLQITVNGCSSTAAVNVNYKPAPVLDLGPDTTLCTGKTLVLNATNANATYLWQDGSDQPELTVANPGVYTVKVIENGCDTTGSITVSYITAPVVNLGNDTTICVTQGLLLNASYPYSAYLWQDGSTMAGYNVSQAGLYAVTVTNNCGSTSDSIRVQYENCACKFYIPNAFSPNNDGSNDVFKPKYICLFSNYECMLFNRWGQQVFSSQNPANGWDGTFKGQQQPPGTYVWVIRYKDNLTGKQMQRTGTVILIR